MSDTMNDCKVSIVFEMDKSRSIFTNVGGSDVNWLRQVNGTAEALLRPDVLELIRQNGAIAVMAQSFTTDATTLVPWHVIATLEDAQRFAQELKDSATKTGTGGTTIGNAILSGLQQLDVTPCSNSEKRVIDVSTDGIDLEATTENGRNAAIDQGVIVNALGVGGGTSVEWLRNHAITPDGFAMPSEWEDYGNAIHLKLAQEMALNRSPDFMLGELTPSGQTALSREADRKLVVKD